MTLCRTVDFYFNKGHLDDPTIPRWVVRARGETFYVDHVDSDAPWSTRELGDGPTKGMLRFRNCHLEIEDGAATITKTDQEETR